MRAWVTIEWYHESMEDGGGCGEAKAAVEKRKLGLLRRISKHDRSKLRWRRNGEGKAMVLVCRNVKGEATIYRTERGEKANRPPRFMCPLRYVTSPPFKDRAHAIFGRALKGHAG